MGFFRRGESVQVFVYPEVRVGITLTGLTPPHLCACPTPGHGFPKLYVVELKSIKLKLTCQICSDKQAFMIYLKTFTIFSVIYVVN